MLSFGGANGSRRIGRRRALMLVTAGPAESGSTSTPTGYPCPVCSRTDHVEKASSLVRRNSGSVLVGGATYPYVSNLAALLAPPERPRATPGMRVVVAAAVSWAITALVLAGMFGLREQMPRRYPGEIHRPGDARGDGSFWRRHSGVLRFAVGGDEAPRHSPFAGMDCRSISMVEALLLRVR
jgi:hypothetical protein